VSSTDPTKIRKKNRKKNQPKTKQQQVLNPAAREGQEIRTYVRLNKYFPFRDKKSLKILKG
jgi:hypothetical protein